MSVQEELAQRAEKLRDEPNLDRAGAALRELEHSWRQAKEAPKDKGEALWTRFKAARDEVRAKVDAHLAKQAEEQAANLRNKEALCEKAEALAESTDWIKTAEALRALQAEWKASGPVAHALSQRIWERFRKPCDRFFTRFQEHREERGREWEQNLHKKEALCEKAEALAASTLWEEAAAGIKQLQAEWRAIGPVKKSRADAVWQRFRAACDLFFDRYKNRDAHAREAARQAREGICAELEALAPADAPLAEPPGDLVGRVQAAQTAWRQAGGLPQDEMAALDQRFLTRATGCWRSTRARSRAASSTPRRAASGARSWSRASRRCSRSFRRRRRAKRSRRSTSPPACATRSPPTRSAAARRSSSAGRRPRTTSRPRRRPGSGSGRCPAPRAARSWSASRAPAGASPSSDRRASGRAPRGRGPNGRGATASAATARARSEGRGTERAPRRSRTRRPLRALRARAGPGSGGGRDPGEL